MRVSGTFLLLLGLFTVHSSALAFQSDQVAAEESQDYYKKWLDEDVKYIITDEERSVFGKLQTDAEKDAFIEQFWRRRDPDPRTSINEYKEEFYRRIQYANEHFTSGLAGWKTDRGMVYIKYGPPDDIDDHPAGSTYVRPSWEGGGITSVYPFQTWRYNYIDGVGSDIEIEFVDTYGGNLYRFSNDALEKDALLYIPGAGLTRSEEMLGGDKSERIVTRSFADQDAQTTKELAPVRRAKDAAFERMRILKEVESPVEIKYQDLKHVITTKVRYNDLSFRTQISIFNESREVGMLPVSITVPDSQLTFKPAPATGVLRATVEVYGNVTTLTNRVVHEFEDTLVREKTGDVSTGSSVAQRKLFLPPGRYKLSIIVRDVNGDKMGTGDFGLIVPAESGRLTASSLVLADSIVKAPAGSSDDPLVLSSDFKVVPNVQKTFHRGEDVKTYLELYNFEEDQSSQQPALKVHSRILKDGTAWALSDDVVNRSVNHLERLRDRLLLVQKFSTSQMESGNYRLVLTFQDELSGEATEAAADFKVVQ